VDYRQRSAMNNLLANKQYYDTQKNADYAQLAASSAVGTAYAIDGQTGRVLSAVADGSERFNSITNSSLLGVTTPAYARGNSGNSGYGDGR